MGFYRVFYILPSPSTALVLLLIRLYWCEKGGKAEVCRSKRQYKFLHTRISIHTSLLITSLTAVTLLTFFCKMMPNFYKIQYVVFFGFSFTIHLLTSFYKKSQILDLFDSSSTAWPEPIWIKVKKSWKIPPHSASKHMPKRPRLCINWNPPFQTQIYLVKVCTPTLNVNMVKQDLQIDRCPK